MNYLFFLQVDCWALFKSAWLPLLLFLLGSFILGWLLGWIMGKSKVSYWSKRYDEKDKAYNNLEVDYNKSLSLVKDNEVKIGRLTGTISDHENNLGLLKNDLIDHRNKLGGLETKRDELEKELAALGEYKTKFYDLQPQFDNAVKKNGSLQTEINDLRKKKETIQKDLDNINKKNVALKTDLSNLEPFKTKFDELSPKYDVQSKLASSLKSDLERTVTEVDAVKKDNQTKQATIDELMAKLKGLEAKTAELTENNDKLSNRISPLEKANGEMILDLEKCRSHKTNLDGVVAERDAALAKLRAELEAMKAQNSQYASNISGFQSQIASLTAAAGSSSNLEAEIAALKKAKSESDDWAAKLENTNSDLNDELARLKAELAKKAEAPVDPPKPPASKEEETLARIKAKAAALDFTGFGAAAATGDDLKEIKGVGPFLEKKLNALGINSFLQIAKFKEKDIDQVNDAIEFFPGRVKRDDWVGQAKILAGLVDAPKEEEKPAADDKSEEAALARIKAKAKDLDFGRIGAAGDKADDLKEISGIGPFLERKLNALGINTFRQIANFDDADIDKVNDAIEFFPGRVRRDDWKGQAKVLMGGATTTPIAPTATPTPTDAGERDDLKRIRGVGPYVEKKLNGLGVTSLTQIAAMNETDVANLNAALEFPAGQIAQEDWVGQAKEILK